jgi:lipopolysaccharide export system permease protein
MLANLLELSPRKSARRAGRTARMNFVDWFPMRIITRYVLFDLLKVFLLTLTGLTVIIFIGLIGKEAIDKGLTVGILFRMSPYFIPQALQFAVPGTMLLATTSVYGRMSSYNEIVAIKSLGISPMAMVWPTLALATLVSFVGVIVNDIAVSWGTTGARRVLLSSLEEVVYSQLKMRRTFNVGKYNITVRDVQGHKLISPVLIVQASGNKSAFTVSAEEAELDLLPDEGKIVARFHKFEVEGPIVITDPDTFPYEMPIEDFAGWTPKSRSPSEYALAEIRPAIQEQSEKLERVRQSNVAQATFGMITGDFDSLSNTAWKPYEKDMEAANTRLYRLHTEPWRRWANGFSCLCFVLIGIPVSIRMRFSEFIASFFICFLPILVVYYPLLAVSVDKAKDGFFPPPAVWLGNIVLAIAGIWLMRQGNKH